MNEVSHRLVAATLEAANRIAVSPESLVKGLPIDLAALKDPGNIDWELFAELLERIGRRSTEARLIAMGRELIRIPVLGRFADPMRFLLSPRRLMITKFRWSWPRDFQHLRTSVSETERGILEARVEIPRHYKASRAFFTIFQGSIEAMPTLVGYGQAQVRRNGSSHVATYKIRLPPSRTLTTHVHRLRQVLLRPDVIMEDFGLFLDGLRAGWEDSERSREELFRTLDRLPDSAFVCRDGQVLYANDAFLTVLGLSSFEEAQGGILNQACSPEHRSRLQAYVEGESVLPSRSEAADGSRPEFTLTRRDGEEVVMQFVSRSEIHFLGMRAALVVARDVTDRKAMERQLAEQQRLVALGEMAAAIGHEIRNPITTVRLLADNLHRLSEGEISRERVAATAERLVQTSERIVEIVSRMGTFSRAPSREKPVSTPLARVVEDAIALCQESFRLRYVAIECGEVDPTIHVKCRPIELGQVLVNLFQNALDASEEGEERWVRLDVQRREEQVELSVIDSGPGVPPSMASRIFEPFFTTKPVGRGTGLGLSLSRRLIQEQGGALSLDEVHERTRFVVTLPLG